MKYDFGQIMIQSPLTNADAELLPFYLLHAGSMKNQHPCDRPNGLVEYQLLFCTEGSGYLFIDGKTYSITAGMGMYFKPNVPHKYYSEIEPWTTHWILFKGSAVDMIPSINKMGKYSIFYIYALDKLMYLQNKIYSSAKADGLLNINEVSLNLYQYLLDLDSCIGCTPKSKKPLHTCQLNDVINYIEANYSDDILLDTLADIAGITPQHLCRLFKSTYHMRPIEYLTKYRMKQAKHLLMTQKECTLKEIAGNIGFHDLSYFCTQFRKSEGMTPVEFKDMH